MVEEAHRSIIFYSFNQPSKTKNDKYYPWCTGL